MFLFHVMALTMAFLIAVLSLSSVSPALHDLVFHGKERCANVGDRHSCGSHDKQDGPQEKGSEEPPCPVLLLAKGFLAGDHQPDLIFQTALVTEPSFFFAPPSWVLRKHDPFGARGPPFLA
jgi:hypothetical protein